MNTTNRRTGTTVAILAAVAMFIALFLAAYFLYGRQGMESDVDGLKEDTVTRTPTARASATATRTPTSTHTPTVTRTPQPTNTLAPTQTTVPTATPLPPTAAVPAPTTAPTATTAANETVNVYLIALGDNGTNGPATGCGDSVVFATRPIPAQSTVEGRITAALATLFSIRDQTVNGFYNSLYQSQLTIDSVTLQAGVAVVNLSGTVVYGDDCDRSRVEGQIEQTILQFPEVNTTQVFLNDVPLEAAGG